MPLKIYRRPNGFYHIRGTHHGVRVDRSARTLDRDEADEIRSAIERRIIDEQIHGKKPERSFAEAVIGYVRGGGEGRYLSRIVAMIGAKPLSSISTGSINDLAAKLYPSAKPSTVNRCVHTPIAAVLNWAVEEEWTHPRRIRRPKQPRGRVDWRTPEEIEALLSAAAWSPAQTPSGQRDIPFAGFLTFLVGVGCRVSEALDLEWRDVSPDGERVTFWETKGGYSRHVDLQPRVRAQLPPRGEGRVWPWWAAYDAVNNRLASVCGRDDLPLLSAHVLRHTWATWRYAATKDLDALMKAGGWKSPELAMRYIHAGTDDLKAAVHKHGWEISGSAAPKRAKRRVKT